MQALHSTAVAEGRSLTAKESQQFDELSDAVAALDAQIGSTRPAIAAFRAKMAETSQPPLGNVNPHLGQRVNGNGETWRDRDGNPVRVYAKGEPLSSGAQLEYDLGDVVKYLGGARVRPEIKAALSEGSNGDGGYLIAPEIAAQIIDKLRAKSRVFEAGAKLVPIPTPTYYMGRLTGDASTVWHAESTADLGQASPTFDRVTFTVKTLSTLITMSRELLEDAPNVNAIVMESITKAVALELDRAALLGDGSSNSPTGLAHYGGVTSTALNAAPSDYSALVASAGRNFNNNAALPTAFIMSPRTLTAFNNLQDTLHQPLRRPDMIADIPMLDTSKIPVNDASGSPVVNNASKIYAGDFTEMMIGMRVGFDLRKLVERYADSGQIGFWAWTRLDIQLAHPLSFDIITDVRP